MKDWQEALVATDTRIVEAIRVLDDSDAHICLVVDGGRKLLGTVTDGDIRRGILRSIPLDAPVDAIMNTAPKVVSASRPDTETVRLMTSLSMRQMPVVDGDGQVVDLKVLDDLMAAPNGQRPNWVVLMAGGRGMRLRPLTRKTPKPLLSLSGTPILEWIVKAFLREGFHRFLISVNYKADLVKEHLGDGSRLGAEIRYLEESTPLGTAGPLGLIDERPQDPIFVMNGDILTKVNVARLLDFHQEQEATATMAVGEYEVEVPYGVVVTDGPRVAAVEEKPKHRFYINAGMYVLDPTVLDLVERDNPLDMPDLFRRLIDEGRTVAAFPVREYWLDIGRRDDFDRARTEFDDLFGSR